MLMTMTHTLITSRQYQTEDFPDATRLEVTVMVIRVQMVSVLSVLN